MTEKKREELVEIDAQRFREFYGHFEDGRSAAETSDDRMGSKYLRINKRLRDKLGQPPSRDYWLGSKSVLEDWKSGKSPPQRRERKVLQTIYAEWNFDISTNQEFSDRIVVEEPVVELLEIEGVTLEPNGLDRLILKLKRLELFTKVREVKNDSGKPLGSRAKLGFSEVSLVVEFSDSSGAADEGANPYKISLELLTSGQPQQNGSALGMDVIVDGERPVWRLYAAPMIHGRLQKAQLIDLFDSPIKEVTVRVEAAKADFNPIVFPDAPSGNQKKDTDERERAKTQLQAQVLKRRLNKDDELYILAAGRIAQR